MTGIGSSKTNSNISNLEKTTNNTYCDYEQDSFQQSEQWRDRLDDRVGQNDGKRQDPGESGDHIDVAEERKEQEVTQQHTFYVSFYLSDEQFYS